MSKTKTRRSALVLGITAGIVALVVGVTVFIAREEISALPENLMLQPTASPVAHSQLAAVLATIVPTPTPTPTPKPYPPAGYHCTRIPILMYHHVEPLAQAKTEGHAPLTVDAGEFAKQMQFVADRGYTTIHLSDVSHYFDGSFSLPSKPIVLTFDDGYSDFYTFALPQLSAHNFKSELFVPTGLMENPGYLTWGQIKSASTQNVAIDHHTWSHANVARSDEAFFKRELDVATQQLVDHGYGPVTIFAYPYGTHSGKDISELSSRGFTLAVTTEPGQLQCKEDRLALHRTRIGNTPLSSYGL